MLCHRACNSTTTHKTQTAKGYASSRDGYRIRAVSRVYGIITGYCGYFPKTLLPIARLGTLNSNSPKQIKVFFGRFSLLTTFS